MEDVHRDTFYRVHRAIRERDWERCREEWREPGWTRERLQGFLPAVIAYGAEVSMLEAMESAAATRDETGIDWAGFRTPIRETLLFSAWNASLETIEWLLNRGVDPCAVDARGRTAEQWWERVMRRGFSDHQDEAKFEALRRPPCGLK